MHIHKKYYKEEFIKLSSNSQNSKRQTKGLDSSCQLPQLNHQMYIRQIFILQNYNMIVEKFIYTKETVKDVKCTNVMTISISKNDDCTTLRVVKPYSPSHEGAPQLVQGDCGHRIIILVSVFFKSLANVKLTNTHTQKYCRN